MGANFWQSWVRGVESVKLAEDQRLSLTSTGATGYATQEGVILADGIPLDVFDEQAYLTSLQGSRAQAASFLNSFGGELAAVFAELSKVIAPVAPATAVAGAGIAATDPTTVLPILYTYMATAPAAQFFRVVPRVNSRNLTYGTPTYGASNAGNGTLYRLTVDAYGFNMEGGFAETKNMLCVADAQSGTIIGQEQFTVFGQPFRDPLTWFASGYGSGGVWAGNAGLVGVTADTTQPLVQNSSFSQSTGTGATSDFALTGWTQTAGLAASMALDTTTYYRAAAIEGTTPASLAVTASVTIKQLLSSNAGALANTAYLSRLAVNFQSRTGSVTVQIGSQSWTVNSGVAGWNLLLPARDTNLWFKNFNTAALAVTITITVTGGSGTLLVDDFCWSPMTAIDGTMWWLIGGSTAFRVNDTAQAVDTEPSPPSKVQNWIRLMFPGYYLPSAVQPARPATAPTLAVGAAGIVTAGTHVGYYSYVIGATGAESGLSPVSNVVLMDGATQVAFSGVTAGGAGVTARNLYLSKTGGRNGVDTPYYVGQIADNVTTTASVNLADASLTAIAGPVGDPL